MGPNLGVCGVGEWGGGGGSCYNHQRWLALIALTASSQNLRIEAPLRTAVRAEISAML